MVDAIKRVEAEQPKYGDVIGHTVHGDEVVFTESFNIFLDSLIQVLKEQEVKILELESND